jgi:hypothetical protein
MAAQAASVSLSMFTHPDPLVKLNITKQYGVVYSETCGALLNQGSNNDQ